MTDRIIGKTKAEALHLCGLFIRVIKNDCSPEEIEEPDEAGALRDIAHMQARVKCAVLGWHTVEELLEI